MGISIYVESSERQAKKKLNINLYGGNALFCMASSTDTPQKKCLSIMKTSQITNYETKTKRKPSTRNSAALYRMPPAAGKWKNTKPKNE